jgi:CRP-like cAMP-binding protein
MSEPKMFDVERDVVTDSKKAERTENSFEASDSGDPQFDNPLSEELDSPRAGEPDAVTMVPESMVAGSAVYDAWIAKLADTDTAGDAPSNSREEQKQAALQAMAEATAVIDPNSTFRRWWDFTQIVLLLYVAIAVPYRIGFGKEVLWLESWFWLDVCVDIYFISDVYVSFRTAYVDDEGDLEYRNSKIAVNYLKSWFAIDILSCLPVNYFAYLPSVDADSSTGKSNKLVRLLRLLRLLKLLRLARINRIIARYEQEYYALVSSLKIAKIVFVVGAVGHWLCCSWYALGSLESSFVDRNGKPLEGWVMQLFGNESNADDVQEYGVALYWAMMTMTTVGYGDISPTTEYEYWFVTVAMLLGGFIFGMIVSFLGNMSKDSNPEEHKRIRGASLLNAFVMKTEKNPELTRRIRNFKAYQDDAQPPLDQLGILRQLPWDMAHELAVSMNWVDGYTHHVFQHGMLHKIPFFQKLPELALMRICASLKHVTYSASVTDPETGSRTYIFKKGDIAHEMFIVISGTICITQDFESAALAERRKRAPPGAILPDDDPIVLGSLRAGDFFGELAVLLPPESKSVRTRNSYAETEVCMAIMSYEDLRVLRQEDADINWTCVPHMEQAAATYLPQALSNRARHPSMTAAVHDRIDGLEAKIDMLIQLKEQRQ